MAKLPPGSDGKTMAQMWKEFGDFMNARDVKGNPRAQGNAVKSRAAKLKKDMTSPAYPQGKKKIDVLGRSPVPATKAKRVPRSVFGK